MSFLKEYTILGELGSGGFAKVYKVRHDKLGYIRAIRVLNETIVDENSKTYQKFLRECKTLLLLGNGSHNNIVHIYQPRLLESHALVEMDYVDGMDLLHYLGANGNFVPVYDVLRMVEDISSALAYCHEDIYKFCYDRNEDKLSDDPNDGSKVLLDDTTRQRLIDKYKVIHNDIHSGNIMRRDDGSYVLLDFGLAIIGGDDVRNSSRHEGGAVEFKPPEKWDDDSVLSEQSDIYSFGIVTYEYLAGRVPFPYDKRISNKSEAMYLLCNAHKKANPPSIFELRKSFYEAKNSGAKYDKDYPDWLEELILKCLAKNSQERFHNGKELYAFVRSHLDSNSLLACRVQELERENNQLRNTAIHTGITQQSNADTSDAKLKQKVDELSEEISTKDSDISTLNAENKKLSGRIEEIAKEKSVLQSNVTELQQRNNSLSGDVAKMRDENNRLEGIINDLKSNSSRRTKPLPIVLCVLFAIVAGLFVFLWLNKSDDDECLTRLESEKKQLSEQLASVERDLSNLQGQYGILNDSLSSKDKQIVHLKDLLKDGGTSEDMIALQEQLTQLSDEIDKYESYLDAEKKKTLELTAANSKLTKENENLKKNSGNLANAQKRISDLEKEKNALEGQVSSLNTQLSAEKKKTSELAKSNSKLTKENENLKKNSGSMADAQKRISELENDKNTLEGQVSSLNTQLSAEKKKTSELTASNSSLKKENENLKKNSGTTGNNSSGEVQQEIQSLRNENTNLSKKLEEAKEELRKCINGK